MQTLFHIVYNWTDMASEILQLQILQITSQKRARLSWMFIEKSFLEGAKHKDIYYKNVLKMGERSSTPKK